MGDQYHLNRLIFLAIASLCMSSTVWGKSAYFEHKDWLLVCDNTGTCRAAGYQPDQQLKPVSVLLTRLAGTNSPVTAQIHLSDSQAQSYGLRIQGRLLGKVAVNNSGIGQLNAMQTQSLLASANLDNKIEFFREHEVWPLSDQGLKAVLLKMDDVQARLGTPSALIQKGYQSNTQVLMPKAKPMTNVVAVEAKTVQLDAKSAQTQQIYTVLKNRVKEQDCPFLFNANHIFSHSPQLTALNSKRFLVVLPCWSGAYNFGSGAWVFDQNLQNIIQTVSYSTSDQSAEELRAAHKGRGLGDCWNQEIWHWNGQRYIQTLKQSTGLCKGFLGGAWDLPTLIHEVRYPTGYKSLF